MQHTTLRIVIGSLGLGGAERHLSYILPHLVDLGYQIKVVTLSDVLDLAPILRTRGVDVHPYSLSRKYPRFLRILYGFFCLWREFQKHPFHITHFFLPEAYVLGMIAAKLARYKGKLVMSRRCLNFYQQRRPIEAFIEKRLHPYTTFILANSKRVLQQLHGQEYIPQHKLGLIYNGIDTPTDDIDRLTARKHLNLTSHALVFVIVANLIYYKGHRDLFQALASIRQDLPKDWVLMVVGADRGIQRDLEDLAQSLGIDSHIRWLGQILPVAPILQAADIGILASHEEGFSNAILEKMSCSLPVVVTDVGGNGEAVQDGITGYVVPAKDPTALARALKTLALDAELRAKMGQAGQKQIDAHFTLPICIQRYDTFYQAIKTNRAPVKDLEQRIV